MDRERAILHNVRDNLRSLIIITALFIPCTVIFVVKALIWAVRKLCAYVQRELELYDELYGENKAPLWDKEGIFEAFIKGEDVRSLRQTKNILRPKPEKKRNAAFKTRVHNGIAKNSTVKRPMMLEQFIRDLVHERPCAPLRVYTEVTGKSAVACDEGNEDCAKIDASNSDSNLPITNGIITGANQLREANGSKDYSQSTVSSLCANHKVFCQATSAGSDVKSNEGVSVPGSHVGVHSQNRADKPGYKTQEIGRSPLLTAKRKNKGKAASTSRATQTGADTKVISPATERSTSRVNKGKKREKAVSVGCANQVGPDTKVTSQKTERSSSSANKGKNRDKAMSIGCSNQVGEDTKVTSQANQSSTSSANKGKNRDKDMSVSCSNQVDTDKKVTSEANERSTSIVNKRKKRRKTVSVGCSNQTVASSEQSAKKPRKESTDAAPHCHHIPVPSSSRKIIKEKTSKKAARARAKVTQRKLMLEQLRTDTPSKGQPVLTKANQQPVNTIPFGAPFNANTPSQATDQETTAVQNVLGELVNAKRPLPVTPFTAQLPEESNDTELVSLMEKLHITSSLDPAYVPDVRNSDSADECQYELYDSDGDCVLCDCEQLDDSDGEYELFPELNSLPEQVLQIIQLLP